MAKNVGVAVVGARFVGGRVHVPLFRKMLGPSLSFWELELKEE